MMNPLHLYIHCTFKNVALSNGMYITVNGCIFIIEGYLCHKDNKARITKA